MSAWGGRAKSYLLRWGRAGGGWGSLGRDDLEGELAMGSYLRQVVRSQKL
jgi:hypothetical protein